MSHYPCCPPLLQQDTIVMRLLFGCKFRSYIFLFNNSTSNFYTYGSYSIYNPCTGFLRKVWPSYRGKRAGKIVKLREATRRQRINTVQPREFNRVKAFSTDSRSHNSSNCIYINPSTILETPRSSQETLGKAFVYRTFCFPMLCC